jgi:hypothetical protein
MRPAAGPRFDVLTERGIGRVTPEEAREWLELHDEVFE